MTRWTTARAWAGVHPTTLGLLALSVVALAGLLVGSSSVVRVVVISLPSPLPVPLLLSAAAGVACAVAADNRAKLPLPEPPRVLLARGLWIGLWTGMALLAANAGQLVGSQAGSPTVVRNVVLHIALALAVLRLGFPDLIWLPSLGYLLACMLFGFPQDQPGYYWWAVIMKDRVTAPQILTIGVMFSLAVAAYCLPSAARPT